MCILTPWNIYEDAAYPDTRLERRYGLPMGLMTLSAIISVHYQKPYIHIMSPKLSGKVAHFSGHRDVKAGSLRDPGE